MLSRVAEKLYWMARYIERTENTARLIRSYNRLILDIPVGSEPSWLILADILDAKAEFKRAYNQPGRIFSPLYTLPSNKVFQRHARAYYYS